MVTGRSTMIYILRYLYENTDEDNGVTIYEIMDYLKERGLEFAKRSVKIYIKELNECFEDCPNIEILDDMEDGKKKYRLVDRFLEPAEVEMLMSALDSVVSFSKSDVENIKEKLLFMLSIYQRKKIKPVLSASKKSRKEKGSIAHILEVISRAIELDRKTELLYYSNSRDLPSIRRVSPYKLHSAGDDIYILGKCDEHDSNISYFRVDRIEKAEICDEKRTPCKSFSELEDIINYSKDMSFGERGTAVFIFTKKVERVVLDRYGSTGRVYKLADGRSKIFVEEYFTDTLLGWIFSLGNEIEVEGSKLLIDKMKKRVTELAERMCKKT